MNSQLTKDECEFILACLKYTRLEYESTEYPNAGLRKEQFDRLSAVEEKLRKIRDE